MATKQVYLESWQSTYNSYEINHPRERNPVQPVISRLIDAVKRQQAFDVDDEARTLVEATMGKGKEKWDGKCQVALLAMQDLELNSMLMDLDSLDEWMNEHLVTQVLVKPAPFAM